MTRRDLTTSLALAAAAFALTCGISYWNLRRGEAPAPQRRVQNLTREVVALTPVEMAPLPSPQLRSLRLGRPSRLAPEAAAVAQSPAAAAVALEAPAITPAPNGGAVKQVTPVPANVQIRKSAAGTLEVSLQNTSSESIEIGATLTDVRNNTRAELEFAAEPQSVRILGMSDGWKLESGDQVTVTSAPFGERVVKVP
jgi:hypothetical protein